ncbi:MAG TPA: hypothetical protein VFE18_08355 [Phenylobacterium sp.]|jgi:hypothetical protein|uniref:hypothetical protein n=1 Tax=Phenylobacterium sp. TaxID=1871053 RepID=UPI002D26510C|nr:hypothetical protein [Phenylobacterium sp.]HZZ68173.1 hypothetical protein [Phenylobacterium sp.]
MPDERVTTGQNALGVLVGLVLLALATIAIVVVVTTRANAPMHTAAVTSVSSSLAASGNAR